MDRLELPDEELIHATRQGDASALRMLFERYENQTLASIRAHLHPRLRSKIDAEDILQEAYLVVARRLQTFEGERSGSFALWFSRIVKNKVREAMRRHLDAGRRDVRCERDRGARPPTSRFLGREPSPSQLAVGNELVAKVRLAMLQLPSDYVEVLRLAHVEGATLRDVADVMQRSYEAVKKLYRRATGRLMELLQDETPDARAG